MIDRKKSWSNIFTEVQLVFLHSPEHSGSIKRYLNTLSNVHKFGFKHLECPLDGTIHTITGHTDDPKDFE